MRRVRRFAAALLLAALAAPASAQRRPATYEEFDVSIRPGDGAALTAVITGGQNSYLYLQRGGYELRNPVVIERAQPLFVHGADRMHVRLVAKDPTRPLFLVKSAPLVNFAGPHFWPGANDDVPNSRPSSRPTHSP